MARCDGQGERRQRDDNPHDGRLRQRHASLVELRRVADGHHLPGRRRRRLVLRVPAGYRPVHRRRDLGHVRLGSRGGRRLGQQSEHGLCLYVDRRRRQLLRGDEHLRQQGGVERRRDGVDHGRGGVIDVVPHQCRGAEQREADVRIPHRQCHVQGLRRQSQPAPGADAAAAGRAGRSACRGHPPRPGQTAH